MTPSSPDLKELAKQAIDQGEYEALDFLIAKLRQPQAVPAIVKPKAATVQPVLIAETALPGLDQSRFLSQREMDSAVTKYLRQLDQRPFRFKDVADYVESNYLKALDPVFMSGDRRPKWRRQISNALEDFCRKGWLNRGPKNTHYTISAFFAAHPHLQP